jgi:hypothetical protein
MTACSPDNRPQGRTPGRAQPEPETSSSPSPPWFGESEKAPRIRPLRAKQILIYHKRSQAEPRAKQRWKKVPIREQKKALTDGSKKPKQNEICKGFKSILSP